MTNDEKDMKHLRCGMLLTEACNECGGQLEVNDIIYSSVGIIERLDRERESRLYAVQTECRDCGRLTDRDSWLKG